jgi:hypothetical protein
MMQRTLKKSYSTPSLIRYGKVSTLTTGGTGMRSEARIRMGMVSCNYNVMRQQDIANCPDIP